MKKLIFLIPTVFLIGFSSCKKETSNDDFLIIEDDLIIYGDASVTAVGDGLDETYTGIAYFDEGVNDESFKWSLFMHDIDEDFMSNKFEVAIEKPYDDVSELPEVGVTYSLGYSSTGVDAADFAASFMDKKDGDYLNSEVYYALFGESGTIKFTTYTENIIKGEFQFQARRMEGYLQFVGDTILVQGTFTAYD